MANESTPPPLEILPADAIVPAAAPPSPLLPPPPPDLPLQIAEKARLESEKLQAEIDQARADTEKAKLEAEYLKRPWYKKSSVLQLLAVIVVTVVGTFVGFANGFFQSKFDKLAADTEKAQIENDKGQAGKRCLCRTSGPF